MNVTHYDASKVYASLGAAPIEGFMPDSFLSIEFNEDFWTVQVGVDGKANTRSKNNNRSATITLSIMQTSPTNDLLTGLLQTDEASGRASVPLFIKDAATGAKFLARNAWIKKPPTATFGAEAGAWDWTIETDRLLPVYGDPTFREV